jgi:hypothetical protein
MKTNKYLQIKGQTKSQGKIYFVITFCYKISFKFHSWDEGGIKGCRPIFFSVRMSAEADPCRRYRIPVGVDIYRFQPDGLWFF